ncbi:MAG: Tol-Pal system beta propeller repeat protein TolB [Deltaproteobacteria bacterium]|nr:Tol-Pal system beta propeller repeat protein TolB [Deltaproteobacteria bacterium]
MKKHFITISVLLFFIVGARQYLDINNPDMQPYPLAFVPVLPLEDNAEEVNEFNEALNFDLELAGIFKVISPKAFIADTVKEGFSDKTIQFQNWADIGADGLIKGFLIKDGDKIKLEMRLFEVGTQKMVMNKVYNFDGAKVRYLAHSFANEVYKFYTGEKGIFLTKIVFVRKYMGEHSINIIDIDGSNEQKIVSNGSINILPSWHPMGTSILYTSFINHNPDLFEFIFSSKISRVVSNFSGLNVGGQYSPDGKKIALTLSRDDNSEIYILDTATNKFTRLTKDWGIDSSPSWSPDGKKIAFVSNRSGNPHIYIMNADGSDQKRITFKGTYNQTPKWSPKGDRILFTARDERNVFDIFYIDVSTLDIKRLTQDQGNNMEPSFSPNGQYIVFTSTRGGSSQLYIMTKDGLNQKRISSGKGECFTPAWSPFFKEE